MRSIRNGVVLSLLAMFLCTSLGGCFYGGGGDRHGYRGGGRRGEDDDGFIYRRPPNGVRAPVYVRIQPRKS